MSTSKTILNPLGSSEQANVLALLQLVDSYKMHSKNVSLM